MGLPICGINLLYACTGVPATTADKTQYIFSRKRNTVTENLPKRGGQACRNRAGLHGWPMTTVILCGKTGTLHFLPCCFLCFLHTVGFVFVQELRGRKGSGAVLAAGLRTSSGQQLGQRDPFVQEELPLLRRKKGGVWIGPCFSSSHAGAAVF